MPPATTEVIPSARETQGAYDFEARGPEAVRELPPERYGADTLPAEAITSQRSQPLRAHAGQAPVRQPLDIQEEQFQLLQVFEGTVQRIEEGSDVVVVITDRTCRSNPAEEAVLDIEEFPEFDRDELEPGTVFDWRIGYMNTRGSHRRVSEVRVRRVPRLSRRQVERAARDAENIRLLLFPEDDGAAGPTEGG
jgi:hypothetical protein